MDTLFPKTIVTYIGLFASAFAANNFLYFRGFMLGCSWEKLANALLTLLESASFSTKIYPVGNASSPNINGILMTLEESL